ncbi:Vegetative incompatibility protein HET-E-1-like protein 24 [Colletotrichum chlorophyti]|uniref:Vegetative incompatibility protein HET-E-1-like protein 24 n=1 Tax=Colletotrichum chlorophyti TaxID=708187 RepID=A0A1Q8RT03_9PEZI|nr:Vegetative incompatibility protein HET-E-1-like protein 24 [Colletotrichum chlorophyti]
MRLLNTTTLELREFSADIPAYAILSHTWGFEEVLYQDMLAGQLCAKLKAGYKKIEGCCQLATKDDFEWIWIDTCCIDKSSSAELSEAINSMFQWYREASICYAYLIDVPNLPYGPLLGTPNSGSLTEVQKAALLNARSIFTQSRWFTRGWTLQELLAPRLVEFHSSDWSYIGTKDDLADLIELQTGISKGALTTEQLQRFPVMTRMQ